MIGPLVRSRWLDLRRDRPALALTFALPIAFFSLFAAIFGGMSGGGGDGGPAAVSVVIVDVDDTATSRAYAKALAGQSGIDARDVALLGSEADGDDAARARRAVRRGDVSVAVILPEGFGEHFADFGAMFDDSGAESDEPPPWAAELVYDAANPIAQFTVGGLMQAAAFTAAPARFIERGADALAEFGGGLTPVQRLALATVTAQLDALSEAAAETPDSDTDTDTDGGGAAAGGGIGGLVQVRAIAAQDLPAADAPDSGENAGNEPTSARMISYYAAGIGVMFLLFSCAGAAGLLLDEEERGTLERLLAAGVGMPRILAANWIFFAAVGVAQLLIMFIWAVLVFGLPVPDASGLVGLACMILATAAACAAFGVALATLCRSRAQMSGLSTIVILIMSALGGSMVPKFVMPAFMQTTGKFTINGWALDGFLAVLWYREPGSGLGDVLADVWFHTPAVPVLLAATIGLLAISRILARRWETA